MFWQYDREQLVLTADKIIFNHPFISSLAKIGSRWYVFPVDGSTAWRIDDEIVVKTITITNEFTAYDHMNRKIKVNFWGDFYV